MKIMSVPLFLPRVCECYYKACQGGKDSSVENWMGKTLGDIHTRGDISTHEKETLSPQ